MNKPTKYIITLAAIASLACSKVDKAEKLIDKGELIAAKQILVEELSEDNRNAHARLLKLKIDALEDKEVIGRLHRTIETSGFLGYGSRTSEHYDSNAFNEYRNKINSELEEILRLDPKLSVKAEEMMFDTGYIIYNGKARQNNNSSTLDGYVRNFFKEFEAFEYDGRGGYFSKDSGKKGNLFWLRTDDAKKSGSGYHGNAFFKDYSFNASSGIKEAKILWLVYYDERIRNKELVFSAGKNNKEWQLLGMDF